MSIAFDRSSKENQISDQGPEIKDKYRHFNSMVNKLCEQIMNPEEQFYQMNEFGMQEMRNQNGSENGISGSSSSNKMKKRSRQNSFDSSYQQIIQMKVVPTSETRDSPLKCKNSSVRAFNVNIGNHQIDFSNLDYDEIIMNTFADYPKIKINLQIYQKAKENIISREKGFYEPQVENLKRQNADLAQQLKSLKDSYLTQKNQIYDLNNDALTLQNKFQIEINQNQDLLQKVQIIQEQNQLHSILNNQLQNNNQEMRNQIIFLQNENEKLQNQNSQILIENKDTKFVNLQSLDEIQGQRNQIQIQINDIENKDKKISELIIENENQDLAIKNLRNEIEMRKTNEIAQKIKIDELEQKLVLLQNDLQKYKQKVINQKKMYLKLEDTKAQDTISLIEILHNLVEMINAVPSDDSNDKASPPDLDKSDDFSFENVRNNLEQLLQQLNNKFYCELAKKDYSIYCQKNQFHEQFIQMQYQYQNELEQKENDLEQQQKELAKTKQSFEEYQIKLKKQFIEQTREFEQNQLNIFNEKIQEEILKNQQNYLQAQHSPKRFSYINYKRVE